MAPRSPDAPLDERALSKLRWRCRRGMLENDLILERFFSRHGTALTERQAVALGTLMELSDNDLLDLHLGRRTPNEIDAALSHDDIVAVLDLLRDKH